jgi:nucleotide-binding universal stress UspA family protein
MDNLKILVGINFEEESDLTIKNALFLKEKFKELYINAGLELFHIIEENPYLEVAMASNKSVNEIKDQIKKELNDLLKEKLVKISKQQGVDPSITTKQDRCQIYSGEIINVLNDFKHSKNCFFIIGQKPLNTFEKIFKSNFAYKIISTASQPALITKNGHTHYKNILVPLSFENTDEGLIQSAQIWASVFKAKLHLVHVTTPPQYPIIPEFITPQINTFNEEVFKQIAASSKEALVRYQEKIQREFRGEKLNCTNELLIHDDSSEALLNYANDNSIDLIIMGTHGNKGLKKLRFGSNALSLIENAKADLFVIPSKSIQ